ncbi:MAG: hypothetical protein RL346_2091 [Verrucomicrobiota bacterium]|jgi:hypothetical protein
MHIFKSHDELAWGNLDVPLFAILHDWYRVALDRPGMFSLLEDPNSLWFIGIFNKPAATHPQAEPLTFLPELWKYDVAELFISNPTTGAYLEFNLASHGAWWACAFSSVRCPRSNQPDFERHVQPFGDATDPARAIAAMRIPLDFLKFEIDFGSQSGANVTMIRNTPDRQYLSVAELSGSVPDFHQPEQFPPMTYVPILQKPSPGYPNLAP